MTEIKEINQLEYARSLTKLHKLPVQLDDGTILQSNVGDVTQIAVNEVIESVNDYVADAMDDINNITLQPTGFTNKDNITLTYAADTRKVTLTGLFAAYYKGVLISELTNGWVSIAHPAILDKVYYLVYGDSGFTFSDVPNEDYELSIAKIYYLTGSSVAIQLTYCTLRLNQVYHDANFSGEGSNSSPLTLAELTTYENNAEAFAAIGAGRLYIRAGHGLDISVTV